MPLIVLNYPGETADRDAVYSYVTAQHQNLFALMEKLSKNHLDTDRLSELIVNCQHAVENWTEVVDELNLWNSR